MSGSARKARGGSATNFQNVVVLDNGAGFLKFGLRGEPQPRVLYNAVGRIKNDKRVFFPGQIEAIPEKFLLGFRRPFQKGVLLNISLEVGIWEHAFTAFGPQFDPADNALMLSETPLNLPPIQHELDEIAFEKFRFHSLCRTVAAPHAVAGSTSVSVDSDGVAHRLEKQCALVVDSGFSYTHTTPVFDGTALNYATQRIDIGGKHISNRLNELLSFRQVDLRDQPYICDEIKRRLCYMAVDFEAELKRYKKKKGVKVAPDTWKAYVLPNGTSVPRGYVLHSQDDPGIDVGQDDIMTALLKNERISVPELLMHPSDAGVKQAGIAETLVRSIEACPKEMHRTLYKNILLCGGNAHIANYRQRIETDVRRMAPENFDVRVFADENPTVTSWRGMSQFAARGDFSNYCVSRGEYSEGGSDYCRRKFYG